MAGVTRVNGLNATAGTIHSESCKAFLITVQNASNADIDLRAEDDAVDEAVEMILKEVNPLMKSFAAIKYLIFGTSLDEK